MSKKTVWTIMILAYLTGVFIDFVFTMFDVVPDSIEYRVCEDVCINRGDFKQFEQ